MSKEYVRLSDIRIRDPFVLPVESEQQYYLFGSTDTDVWFGRGEGFRVWRSKDLQNWEGGAFAFQPPTGFWSDRNFWAPEVHLYRGAYYMVASFLADGCHRGVQLLRASRPEGPYIPFTDGPITPKEWDCLDGTLYVESGRPYMIFSHEWTQIQDGAICCAEMSENLTHFVETPTVLFHASEAPWSIASTGNVIQRAGENYVTDGPYLYRNHDGLWMLWSSYSRTGYAIGSAYSTSGSVRGPWKHTCKPFYDHNGGHGMLFKTFDRKRLLAIHTPNESPNERAVFFEVTEDPVLGLRIHHA